MSRESAWHSLPAMEVDLSAMRDADGLTREQRGWVDALVEEYASHAEHNARVLSYYDGNVKVRDYGAAADIDNDQTCHWPAKAVDSLAERIRLLRFVPHEEDESGVAERVCEANDLVSNYNRHVPAKLLNGCMAATVTRGRRGAVVRFHTAETFTAIPSADFTDGVVAAGLAIARRERAPWDPHRVVPTIANLHLPGNVVELRQVAAGKWVAAQGRTAEREPSLYVFAHKGLGTIAPFGRTVITKFVRTLTDDAIRCMWHMQISGAFYSMPKLAFLDLTPEQYDSVTADKLKWQLDRVIATEMDENGDGRTSITQLSGNSPQPFVEELRALACQFSGATGVPLNSLGIVQDNPNSAEAITTAREDICLTAARDIEADGRTLRRVLVAAMAVEENKTIDGLSAEQRAVQAKFDSPMLYSPNAKVDWAVKVNSIRPGFGLTDVGGRAAGIPEEDLPSVKSDELKSAAAAMTKRIFGDVNGSNSKGMD